MDDRLWEDYLFHHGIQGQKWGVRNGPPYPLGESDKSSSEVEAESKQGISTYAMAKLAVYSTVAAIGIAVELHDDYKQKKLREGEKKDWTQVEGPSESLSELKKKEKETTSEDDLKRVVIKPKTPGNLSNCVFCGVAMEMRSRGYDVRARRKDGTGIETKKALPMWFKGAKGVEYRNKDAYLDSFSQREQNFEKLKTEIAKQPNGAHGVLTLQWVNGGGHCVFYKVENGKTTVYDGQSRKIYGNEQAQMMSNVYTYYRLDNLKMTDKVGDCVISSDKKKG